MKHILASIAILMIVILCACEADYHRSRNRTCAEQMIRQTEPSTSIGEELISDLNRLADEDWGAYRITLVFGDIVNKTDGRARVPTTDFEYVRERLLTQLSKSRMFRDNVRFVRGRDRLESLNRRELVNDNDDILQEGTTRGAIERPDAQYMYYLNGDMYAISRGSSSVYYLKFTIDRASDGEVVFSDSYEVKYQ